MNRIERFKKLDTIYGEWNGFPFLITKDQAVYTLKFSVENVNKYDIESEIVNNTDKKFKKLIKNKVAELDNGVMFGINHKIIKKNDKLEIILDTLTNILRREGFVPICSVTKSKDNVGIYRVGKSLHVISESTYQTMIHGDAADEPNNVVRGLLAALGGMAIGAVGWIIINLFGYISVYMGVLVVILAFSMYEKQAGTPTKLMAAIIFIISLIIIPIAEYIAYVITIMMEGESLSDSIYVVNWYLANDGEVLGVFLFEVGLGVLFVVIGGISMIVQIYKESGLEKTNEILIGA